MGASGWWRPTPYWALPGLQLVSRHVALGLSRVWGRVYLSPSCRESLLGKRGWGPMVTAQKAGNFTFTEMLQVHIQNKSQIAKREIL